MPYATGGKRRKAPFAPSRGPVARQITQSKRFRLAQDLGSCPNIKRPRGRERAAPEQALELLSPAEMAAADRAAIAAGTAGIELMERAGRAVAEAAAGMAPGPRVVVLAGTGNNGGDGFVAARRLRQAGYRVTVALHGEPGALRGDAAHAAASFAGMVVPARPALFAGADLIVDALYGAGFRRPLDPGAAELVAAVNASAARVLAVDLPSGIEGASGLATAGAALPQSPAAASLAVIADATLTFVRRKPGHILLPGRLFCGRVSVGDIGIGPAEIAAAASRTFLNRPALWRNEMPRPSAGDHKYRRGHLAVLCGPPRHTGAARLAASAGLRIGAGLVTLCGGEAALAEAATQLTAVMLHPMAGPSDLAALLADRHFTALVLGPALGVGDATRGLVAAALAAPAAAVLDADALTSFATMPEGLFAPLRRRGQGNAVVLTPHEGEFARLFPDLADGAVSKLERAREAARRSGAVIVLKGADTVVAEPQGRASIADNAPPSLATAGSGDVLAGLIGGLLAQGLPAFAAASAAVYLHGEAAAALGPGLTADDLVAALPAALGRMQGAGPAC